MYKPNKHNQQYRNERKWFSEHIPNLILISLSKKVKSSKGVSSTNTSLAKASEGHTSAPSVHPYSPVRHLPTHLPHRPQQICSTDDAFNASGRNPTILPSDMW